MAEPGPPTVAVVGLGQIGASLALGLRDRGVEVLGFDPDPETAEAAAAAGIAVVDGIAAATRCGVLVIAAPLSEVGTVVLEVGAACAGDGRSPIVTDVGSVKAPVAFVARRALPPGVRFVGGHPMAGTERSGFAAGDPNLFDGAPWALAVDEATDVDAAFAVARLVLRVGARVVPIGPVEHDRAVAAVSHLPHVIATSLVAAVAGQDQHEAMLRIAAGSFQGATRVAATRAQLTADLCFANRLPLLDALDTFGRELEAFRTLLSSARTEAELVPFFEQPAEVRGGLDAARWVSTQVLVDPSGDPNGSRRTLLEIGREGGAVVGVARTGGLERLDVRLPVGR